MAEKRRRSCNRKLLLSSDVIKAKSPRVSQFVRTALRGL